MCVCLSGEQRASRRGGERVERKKKGGGGGGGGGGDSRDRQCGFEMRLHPHPREDVVQEVWEKNSS